MRANSIMLWVANHRPLSAALVLLSMILWSCALPSKWRPSGAANAALLATDATQDSLSAPVGKVGFLSLNSTGQLPRAAGMSGMIGGYIVSHPALTGPLTVWRNGRELPILCFSLRIVVLNSSGFAGIEKMLGTGRLVMFFNAEGVDGSAVDQAAANLGQEVEEDDVQFESEMSWDNGTFLIRMSEIAVASRPFKFRGRELRTPVGRSGQDLLFGKFSWPLHGLLLASNSAVADLNSGTKLDAVLGELRY